VTRSEPLTDRVFAAVLFDLDSTLVDSSAAVDRSWRRWAAEYDLTLADLGEHTGLPSRATVARLLAPADVDIGAALIEELEVTDTDGVVALPGAAEAMAAVPDDRQAVVTSCTAALASARLTAAGLVPPRVVVTVDRLRRGKPAPDGYLLAAAELVCAASDCLVVEDSASGISAARAAGCAVLAVATTTRADRLAADLVVGTLADVRFSADLDGVRLSRP
jgi:mannitol-1-/sugar-/sorbitol-6-phosphatase